MTVRRMDGVKLVGKQKPPAVNEKDKIHGKTSC